MKELLIAHLASLKLGEATTHAGLGVFPVLAPEAAGDATPGYVLLDAALDANLVTVAEVSEGGHVPELRLENRAPQPLLLIEGEELVGAKQNRVLNTSLLVAAQSTVTIPVSCVEAGRWRYASADFASSGHMLHSSARRQKVSDVSASVRERGDFRSDQGAVWDAVAERAASLHVHSPTMAYSDVVRQRHGDVEAFRGAFRAVAGQTGVLVTLAGRVLGLDLFAAPATLAALLPKLAQSYALDAVDAEPSTLDAAKALDTARGFLDAIGSTALTAHPSVSLGEAVRFSSPRVAGAALVHEGRVLHLCAFPGTGDGRPQARRMASPSRRRDAVL